MSITQISDFTLRHMIENDKRDKEFQQKQIDRIKQLETELADKDKLIEQMRAIFIEMLAKPRVEVWAWESKIEAALAAGIHANE